MNPSSMFEKLTLLCCCRLSSTLHRSQAYADSTGFPGCPVNFEYANYTILTSRCKGPLYPPDQCCAAFKDFACPYADEINNLNNECASTMFSYINLNGKYPPGLFASECREGKQGLECPASPTLSNRANGIHMAQDKLWLLLFPACFWAVILLLY